MKSTVEVLREARALYEANPSHVPGDEQPVPGSHCPITALVEVELNDGVPYWDAERALENVMATRSIPRWNAEHTTEEVLAAFDCAIEAGSVVA